MKIFGRLPEEDLENIFLKSERSSYELRTSNLIVVGASGFLGEWISTYLIYLLSQNHFDGEIILMSRNPDKLSNLLKGQNNKKVRFINTLTFSKDDLKFQKVRKTFVVYAATSTSLSGSLDNKSHGESILLPEKILSSLTNLDVTFIHLSSGGIYESQARLLPSIPGEYARQDESQDPYISEKIALEKWSTAAEEKNLIVARNPRLFTFFGPGLQLDRHFAIGEFLKLARENQTIVVKGRPENRRSYLYPTDAMIQLLDFFSSTKPLHSQIGSRHSMTIQEVAEMIGQMYKVPVLIQNKENSNIDNYVPEDVPDNPEMNFDLGVKKWSDWLKHLR